ncbi:hypothetical protein HanPI659440_Chr03g0105021 [Helianthus annuus]|nr:hypothetical protein HanPI659440_Chr03g0105021 [Helianthus annuus]
MKPLKNSTRFLGFHYRHLPVFHPTNENIQAQAQPHRRSLSPDPISNYMFSNRVISSIYTAHMPIIRISCQYSAPIPISDHRLWSKKAREEASISPANRQLKRENPADRTATTNIASERRRRLGLLGCPEEAEVFRRGVSVQHGSDDDGV